MLGFLGSPISKEVMSEFNPMNTPLTFTVYGSDGVIKLETRSGNSASDKSLKTDTIIVTDCNGFFKDISK